MKTLLISLVAVMAFLSISISCQHISGQMQYLSDNGSRREMMDSIANDSLLSSEMMDAMMTTNNGILTLQQNELSMMQDHHSMITIFSNNPELMRTLMSDMVETARGDTGLLSSLLRTMMVNGQMRDLMKKNVISMIMNDPHDMTDIKSSSVH